MATQEEMVVDLELKIQEANKLIEKCDATFGKINGCKKLRSKVTSELAFLTSLKSNPKKLERKHIETSNLQHFKAVADAFERYENCVAIYRTFSLVHEIQQTKYKIHADLVVDGGATWVKVVARNARGLYQDFVGANSASNRSIVVQARELKQIAPQYPHLFRAPSIIFDFAHGLPDCVAYELRSIGVQVRGEEIPLSDIAIPIEYSSSESENEESDREEPETSTAEENMLGDASDCDTVNLDVTAMVVYCSELTNGANNYKFVSENLNLQAQLERETPALPQVLAAIEGKKLICCRTAFDAFTSIVNTVGGPNEKRRYEELFQKVKILDDQLSDRSKALKLSYNVSRRAKAIFGSGDNYKAVTLSANRKLLQSALQQGIEFVSIVHESRALTEQKQLNAATLISE